MFLCAAAAALTPPPSPPRMRGGEPGEGYGKSTAHQDAWRAPQRRQLPFLQILRVPAAATVPPQPRRRAQNGLQEMPTGRLITESRVATPGPLKRRRRRRFCRPSCIILPPFAPACLTFALRFPYDAVRFCLWLPSWFPPPQSGLKGKQPPVFRVNPLRRQPPHAFAGRDLRGGAPTAS